MGRFARGAYPAVRLRRLRRADWLRRLVSESGLGASDLVLPLFLTEGAGSKIGSMPGVDRLSVDMAVGAAEEASGLGIEAVALFPYTEREKRDETGSEALNPDNLVCRAVRRIKERVRGIGVICDVALDPYTSHGHDGLLSGGEILNDETVEVLAKQAVVLGEAGCDIVAPSDMMDGRVGAIRRALDKAGYKETLILSYAAKYASALYGPFREAVGALGVLEGDKKTYQMDTANSDEALREVDLDLGEGADMVMVKPGVFYMDVVRRVKERFGVPVFAYQVSGEYAMIEAAGAAGYISREEVMMESLLCLKRSGADGIFTYFALEAARHLRGK